MSPPVRLSCKILPFSFLVRPFPPSFLPVASLSFQQIPNKMLQWLLLTHLSAKARSYHVSNPVILHSSNVHRFFLRPDTTRVDHAIPLRDNWALPYFSCQVAALTGFLSNNISSATEVCFLIKPLLFVSKMILSVRHCAD